MVAGAPLYRGRKKSWLFMDLTEKIRSGVSGWNKNFLSFGGRLPQIGSVHSSMPMRILQVMLAQKSVVNHIHRIFDRFFWGCTENSSRLH